MKAVVLRPVTFTNTSTKISFRLCPLFSLQFPDSATIAYDSTDTSVLASLLLPWMIIRVLVVCSDVDKLVHFFVSGHQTRLFIRSILWNSLVPLVLATFLGNVSEKFQKKDFNDSLVHPVLYSLTMAMINCLKYNEKLYKKVNTSNSLSFTKKRFLSSYLYFLVYMDIFHPIPKIE